MFALRYAARSDVGLIRRGNEDSGYASPHLLIVADGMETFLLSSCEYHARGP